MSLVVKTDKTVHAVVFVKSVNNIQIIILKPAERTIIPIQRIQIMVSRILHITGHPFPKEIGRIIIHIGKINHTVRLIIFPFRRVLRCIKETTDCRSGNNICPIGRIHVFLIRHGNRIAVFALAEIVPDFQILGIAEILIKPYIDTVFLPAGSFQAPVRIAESVMILRIPRHITIRGNKVVPGLVITGGTGIIDCIMVFFP